ncbi:hypothetical protein [Spirilliplanes yamanashiensis]|uniref:Uncharacterized protein n=1 Tax=Spirilliplanes yamanashiensis TaxID=42233 RepID=A0A8J3YCK0_9ACTN|nr:hypothetical protein [Spirilliplanes yamanashiensis]MDP9818821.1 hypothetical protein [Spirilliplanes yamanashiensis]GIJ05275.1 hypothetical protein Sya03_46270 [Spirilliplanes yamanashiensis]
MSGGQVAALAALGAFHGLNPAMGWLFAVARGMQERDRGALLRALPPIAGGHLASVAIVAAVIAATRSAVAGGVVGVAGGVLLVGFGLWRLLSQRHFRWAGMRLSAAQLAGWSFLVSSAHGAGLMLLPVLASGPAAAPGGAGHAGHAVAAGAGGALTGLAAAGVHTVAMFVVAGGLALLVYEVVGTSILRRAWFNVDRLWAAVLVAAGVVTIVAAT